MIARWLFGGSPRFFSSRLMTKVYISSRAQTSLNMLGPAEPYFLMSFTPEA